MAQTEDTELRDLVIETLERNGSLAKIRALLRANIFLAFEDDCENRKQNVNLDNIIKLPDGILALSIVHEFLEFCSLRNTLFVYKSESRQGADYNYEGKRVMGEKLNVPKSESLKEPLLLTILKNCKSYLKQCFDANENPSENIEKLSDKNYNDEQNCTYILHEDSQTSATSNSQSENSSDEKNKVHLRLQLDNSDTDTSSDSALDKNCSEYIPGDHILEVSNNIARTTVITKVSNETSAANQKSILTSQDKSKPDISVLNELKLAASSQSDSTSYIDIKPFNTLDEKLLNTSELPIVDSDFSSQLNSQPISNIQNDLHKPLSILSKTFQSQNADNVSNVEINGKTSHESHKSDADTTEFSYGDDFSSSKSKNNNTDLQSRSLPSEELEKIVNKTSLVDSSHQTQSSQSSVSISDVADLISEKSSSNNKSETDLVQPKENNKQKSSDDSGEFTDSPVPSLSNLSLDIHSD